MAAEINFALTYSHSPIYESVVNFRGLVRGDVDYGRRGSPDAYHRVSPYRDTGPARLTSYTQSQGSSCTTRKRRFAAEGSWRLEVVGGRFRHRGEIERERETLGWWIAEEKMDIGHEGEREIENGACAATGYTLGTRAISEWGWGRGESSTFISKWNLLFTMYQCKLRN